MTDCTNALLSRLDALAKLPKNWDGYGGGAVNFRAIEKATEIAALLPGYNWQAVPGGDGSVQIECHSGGFEIEINIASALQTKPPLPAQGNPNA